MAMERLRRLSVKHLVVEKLRSGRAECKCSEPFKRPDKTSKIWSSLGSPSMRTRSARRGGGEGGELREGKKRNVKAVPLAKTHLHPVATASAYPTCGFRPSNGVRWLKFESPACGQDRPKTHSGEWGCKRKLVVHNLGQ